MSIFKRVNHFRLASVALLSLAGIVGCAQRNLPAGKTFAEKAVKDIASSWNEKTLDRYVGTEYRQHNSKVWTEAMFKQLAESLGNLQKVNNITEIAASSEDSKGPLVLDLLFEATFDKGVGNVTAMVSEHNGRWTLDQLQVKAPTVNRAVMAQKFADVAIQAVGAGWDESTLEEFAGPAFFVDCPRSNALIFCKVLRDNLGKFVSYKGSNLNPAMTRLGYSLTAQGEFERGAANITLVVTDNAGAWGVSGMQFQSPALVNATKPRDPAAPVLLPPGQVLPRSTPGASAPVTAPKPLTSPAPMSTPQIPLPPTDLKTP